MREPQGTMRIGIVEDPTLVSGNQIPQKLLSLRAEKERLTNGYPGEARTIGQDMRDPSSQHFSVAEDLKATEDCLMATSESRRKTAGANFRVLFDGAENDRVFHLEGASRPRLFFEVRISSFEASETAFDSADGSSVFS